MIGVESKMKSTLLHIVVTLSLTVSAVIAQPDSAAAPWRYSVPGTILQQRYDRLYFDAGTERLVFPGCRFKVVLEDSSQIEGTIESSLLGLSVSAKMDTLAFLRLPDSSRAMIDPFAVKANDTVRLGYLDANIKRYAVATPTFPPDPQSSYMPTPIELVAYDSQLEMLFDFESDRIDGVFTDYDPRLVGVPTAQLSAPAPWVVAILPNPGSPKSESGYLTTSLVYRFDPGSLALFFDGDSAEAYYALTTATGNTARPYPFDPAIGRRLIRELPSSVTSVKLAVTDQALSGTAAYFADILSRDRLKTSLTTEVTVDSYVDVLITTLPHSAADPLVTLDSAVARLRRMLPGGSQIQNNIEQAAFHLEAAHEHPDSSMRQAAIRRVVQKLEQDIGVFALFRPHVFLTYRPTIAGIERQDTPPFNLLRVLSLEPPPYLREGAR